MSTGEIISICASSISAIALLFTILTFRRNGSRDIKQETKESTTQAERRGYEKGELNAKLDAIGSGIESIRDDIKGVKGNIGSLEQRMTRAESRTITLEREMHEVRLKLGIVTTEYKGD